MKFSYTLLKKLVPEIKSKTELEEKLTMHAFEVDSIEGNTFDIKLLNRYSDAGGHFGMAQEIAAIYGEKFYKQSEIKKILNQKPTNGKKKAPFSVKIEDPENCYRFKGQYFENIKVGESPKWLKDILVECGMRPINNVVDITNYVMLETGQPLHAYDYDKIHNHKIIIRKGKKKEKITTLDDVDFDLDENVLVIADDKDPMVIAGIKGGKSVEVDKDTTKIVIESAKFNPANIYLTSKRLKLVTDGSQRHARNLSPELVALASKRAEELLEEILDAKAGGVVDIYPKKQPRRLVGFNTEGVNGYLGTDLKPEVIKKYLELLGFTITSGKKGQFIAEVPPLRMDIEDARDIAEEVVRLYGLNNLKPVAPKIHLVPSGFEDQINLKDKIRRIATGFGASEVLNYSFIAEDDLIAKHNQGLLVELQNPISKEFEYMRPSLVSGLVKNINSNSRFFDEVAVFEFGRVYSYSGDKIVEKEMLGMSLGKKGKETFFSLKGQVRELFRKMGITDYLIVEANEEDLKKWIGTGYINKKETVKLEVEGKVIGYLATIKKNNLEEKWTGTVLEIDFGNLVKLAQAEHEYLPLSKYPSSMRDISILVDKSKKVGEIIQTIQFINKEYIEDVDLIDEYEDEKMDDKISLTFRIVFQKPDGTFTTEEVNKEIEKIEKELKAKFKAEMR